MFDEETPTPAKVEIDPRLNHQRTRLLSPAGEIDIISCIHASRDSFAVTQFSLCPFCGESLDPEPPK